MSGPRVVLDTAEWETWIKSTTGKLANVGKLLAQAAIAFAFDDIQDHFSQETGPNGSWPRRSPATQAAYAQRGRRSQVYNPSNKLLQLTGNLRMSIIPGYMTTKRDSVTIFANAPYSAIHDQGGKSIPARPFMWLSDTTQDKMLDVVMELATEGA